MMKLYDVPARADFEDHVREVQIDWPDGTACLVTVLWWRRTGSRMVRLAPEPARLKEAAYQAWLLETEGKRPPWAVGQP